MAGRKIWINFDAHQIFTTHNKPREKCFDLRLFLNHLAEPHFRPLRPKLIQIFLLGICVRVRSRFFDQVGHETMNASSGNKHFLLNLVIIRPTYLNY